MKRSRVLLRGVAALVLVAAAVVLAVVARQVPARGEAVPSVAARHLRAAPELANRASQTRRPAQGPVRDTASWAPVPAARLIQAVGDPTFGQPTISGIQGVGFEQDLRLDPNDANRAYTSVPGSLSSLTSWIWRSVDAGKTFKWTPSAADKTGKPTACAGGGDTELAVDIAHHVYFNDLTLVNFSTARSDDNGTTFLGCSNTGVPDAVVDRQWYAVDGDPVGGTDPAPSVNSIYLANDEIGPGAPTCGSSTGNNELVMYRSPPAGVGATAGLQFGPAKQISGLLTCNEGIMGNNEVSPKETTTGLNGATLATAVRHVYVIHDDATFDHIFVGRCFPVAFGAPVPNVSDPSGLNCQDLPVASFPGSKTGGNFPTMTIDKFGNLYAVWEQAPIATTGTPPAPHVGNSVLEYSFSTNEGTTWSTPMTIPMGTLANAVFAWPAAGDDGRVDIMFLGTTAQVNPNDPNCPDGPDSVNGIWSLYMVQTLDGHAAIPAFTSPILAGEHYMHKGNIQTVMGNQCGDRTLGDFFQLRIGTQGEAQMSYADSNNIDETFAPHGMFVKQNGGTGVFTSPATVTGDPILLNSVSDPPGDGTYDAASIVSPNDANLDILASIFSKPAAASCNPSGTACYRVQMAVNALATAPTAPTGDADTQLVWSTQWLVPADPACTSTNASCANGGKNFHVFAEVAAGMTGATTVKCFSGENAVEPLGGGVSMTYPAGNPGTIGSSTQITGAGACTYTPGTPGTITVDVPIANVRLQSPTLPLSSNRLYSVTASTHTLSSPAETPPNINGIGGNFFNLIDVARGYDADFGSTSVTIASFGAKRAKVGVTVTWKTANGTTVFGFNVFRTDAKGLTRKVNRALVAARRAGTAAGTTYRLADASAKPGKRFTYRLQLVDPAGAKSWYARSVTVR